MAKVMMFPQRKKLPMCIEERLYDIAKQYVETLRACVLLMDVEQDRPTEEEFMELIAEAYSNAIYKAIDELD